MLSGVLEQVEMSFSNATRRLENACRKRLEMEDGASAELRDSEIEKRRIADLKACAIEDVAIGKNEVEDAMSSMLNKLELTTVYMRHVHLLAVAIASRRSASSAALQAAQATNKRLRDLSVSCLAHIASVLVEEAKKPTANTLADVVTATLCTLRPGKASRSTSRRSSKSRRLGVFRVRKTLSDMVSAVCAKSLMSSLSSQEMPSAETSLSASWERWFASGERSMLRITCRSRWYLE